MTPNYNAKRNWQRWHGTLEQIERAVARASQAIREWNGGENEPNVAIEMREKGDVRSSGLTLDALRQMSGEELRGIDYLEIVVGERYVGNRMELLLRSWSPALFLEVGSTEKARCVGLRTTLEGLLRPNELPDLLRSTWITAGIEAVLAAVSFFGALIFILGVVTGKTAYRTNLIILLTTIGAAVVFGLMLGLFPDLEVLDAGKHPRSRRFGAWLFACIVAFGIAIAAATVVGTK